MSKLFSEDTEGDTRSRDFREKHAGGSYTRNNDNTAEIRGKRCYREDKRKERKYAEEKVCVVGQSILERENCVVPRIFCLNNRIK